MTGNGRTGRPKSQNPLGENVPVRLQPEIKASLVAEAEENSMALSTLCRQILVKHVREKRTNRQVND